MEMNKRVNEFMKYPKKSWQILRCTEIIGETSFRASNGKPRKFRTEKTISNYWEIS